jgi:peptide chain release factor 3
MGRELKGVYNLYNDTIQRYRPRGETPSVQDDPITGLASAEAKDLLGEDYQQFVDEIELVRGASHEFSLEAFLTVS